MLLFTPHINGGSILSLLTTSLVTHLQLDALQAPGTRYPHTCLLSAFPPAALLSWLPSPARLGDTKSWEKGWGEGRELASKTPEEPVSTPCLQPFRVPGSSHISQAEAWIRSQMQETNFSLGTQARPHSSLCQRRRLESCPGHRSLCAVGVEAAAGRLCFNHDPLHFKDDSHLSVQC